MNQKNAIAKVFGWMFIGLLLTFITGYYLASNEYTFYKLFTGGKYFLLILIEFGLVIFLSARIHKMSSTTAKIVFMLYSIVTGLTFASIFIVYELQSILLLFVITAGIFGIFALLGYYTKIDLTKMGTFLFMALLGIVACVVINMFLGNSTFDIIITCISIVIFLGYTAYDMQKIKLLIDSSVSENVAIIGALELYLDFINIFLDLLQLFGKSND